MSNSSSAVILGSFDAEQFWREPNTSRLPFMPDKERDFIVSAMDELLFPLCRDQDILITRFGLNPIQHDYLEKLGFRFSTNYLPLASALPDIETSRNIFRLLGPPEITPESRQLIMQAGSLSTYAVIPHMEEFCRNYRIPGDFPSFEAVKKVNSKIYSHQLHERIGLPSLGMVISSSEQLEHAAKLLLQQGPFLIKDPYGVSGKGNLLIASESVLRRIFNHIRKQELQGTTTSFLLEPYVKKQVDFSCQFQIHENGAWQFISVQKMLNQEFAYLGSMQADPAFISMLESKNYFRCMEQIGGELARDGYFGNVCVDSMMLDNGELIPIVEVNARKSMGLINYSIDQYLTRFGLQGTLTFFSTGCSEQLDYAHFLTGLERSGLLFTPKKTSGIVPLAANTLGIASHAQEQTTESPKGKTYKGRCYVSVVGRDMAERVSLNRQFRYFLQTLSFMIYN